MMDGAVASRKKNNYVRQCAIDWPLNAIDILLQSDSDNCLHNDSKEWEYGKPNGRIPQFCIKIVKVMTICRFLIAKVMTYKCMAMIS